MSPVKNRTHTVRRADELRQDLEAEIFAGRLAPGQRLDESKLAARFGVSRTPVREALLQLASIGLVEMRPRQGAVVAAVTIRRLLQMFEVMAELEAFCARLAARRMTPEERRVLEASHRACAEQAERGETDAYYEANRCFHEALYAGAHNRYLEDSTSALRNRLSPYRRFQLNQPGRIKRSLAEHDAVVRAVLAGDPDAAAEAMRDHVAVQGEVFTDLLAALPPDYVQTEAV